MNIAHIVDVLVVGGLETYITTLLNELCKNNNVFLIGQYISKEMRDSLDSKVKVLEHKEDYGVYEDFIIKNNIEILHGHPAAALGISVDIGKKFHIPVVFTYHGLWGWNCPIHKDVNKIISVSTEVYDLLTKNSSNIDKVEIIQNGIDSTKIFDKNTDNKNTDINILFVGRIDKDKIYSIRKIISALKLLEFLDIKLKIAGSGSYLDELKDEVPNWVEVLGFVDGMNKVLNQSDLQPIDGNLIFTKCHILRIKTLLLFYFGTGFGLWKVLRILIKF